MARSRGAPDDAQKAPLTPAWRRWEQAAETLDMAEEAVVLSLAKPELVPPGEESRAQQLYFMVRLDRERESQVVRVRSASVAT